MEMFGKDSSFLRETEEVHVKMDKIERPMPILLSLS